jgi:hypothetical protein
VRATFLLSRLGALSITAVCTLVQNHHVAVGIADLKSHAESAVDRCSLDVNTSLSQLFISLVDVVDG